MTEQLEARKTTRVRGEALVEKVRELLHEGNVRRLVIKDDKGHTVMEIPVTAGPADRPGRAVPPKGRRLRFDQGRDARPAGPADSVPGPDSGDRR